MHYLRLQTTNNCNWLMTVIYCDELFLQCDCLFNNHIVDMSKSCMFGPTEPMDELQV